ncbi:MAG: FlgO family outer membrane protein [Myxococcales bacterium]
MSRWVVVAVLAAMGTSGAALAAETQDEAAGAAAVELAKPVPKAKPKIKLIVVPAFAEKGPLAKGWGAKTADAWAAKLSEVTGVKVLGPSTLSTVLDDLQISALSGTGSRDAAKAAGAQAILTGEVSDQVDRIAVNTRLVSAFTGVVWVASKQSFAPGAKPAAKVETKPEPKPEPVEAKAEPKPEPKVAEATVETKKVEAKQVEAQQPAPKAESDLPRSSAGGVASGRIEIVVRELSDKIAEAFSKLPGNVRYRRLAVIPFNDLGPNAKSHQIGSIVTAEIATVLRRDHGLLLVERAQLSQVMDEMRLKELTQDDPEQANQLAKLADAQALVVGSVADAGDKYLVNAKVVSSATGQMLAAESASLPAAGLVSLASESVVLRSKSGAVFRSLIVPGWGQIYNRQTLKAGIIMGGELALFAGALTFHLTGDWAKGRYEQGLPETSGHWKLAEQRYQWRNILLYVAAGVWVYNILDAYLSGVDGESALSGAMGQSEPKFVPVVSAGKDGATVGGVLKF